MHLHEFNECGSVVDYPVDHISLKSISSDDFARAEHYLLKFDKVYRVNWAFTDDDGVILIAHLNDYMKFDDRQKIERDLKPDGCTEEWGCNNRYNRKLVISNPNFESWDYTMPEKDKWWKPKPQTCEPEILNRIESLENSIAKLRVRLVKLENPEMIDRILENNKKTIPANKYPGVIPEKGISQDSAD